jgi:kynurenine formamidase
LSAQSSDPAEVVGYLTTLSNWNRWGSDDQAGTLNHLSPECRRAAAALVRAGRSISCSRVLAPGPTRHAGTEYLHKMNGSGEAAPERGVAFASDWFAIGFHGFVHTHLDSHAHAFWNGRMYNGVSSAMCTTREGALVGGVEPALGGIFGRGILVDAPALRGVDWLEPGESIHAEDLDDWLESRDVEVRTGDLLWVRTGRDAWERAGHDFDQGEDGSPGLDPDCLPWLHAHDISVVVSDVANDVRPSRVPGIPSPIHTVGLVAMGLWLVDNADLAELAHACQEFDSWEFLSILTPLALQGATGSPINPIAVF